MAAMLEDFRVLDLTDEKGMYCGKLLGDLGADVIKIERPGGDPARRNGPFYQDKPDPEKSLYWFAFNTSKRGVTLDIEKEDGKALFRRMVQGADMLVESFDPGYMARLGLGYTELAKLNPRLVMVSVTPFGQTGPYCDYRTNGLVAWAMGGHMYPCGEADRPPLQVGYHSQAYLHAAVEGAAGGAMALYHRELTGEGEYVDVSVHDAVAGCTFIGTASWETTRINKRRGVIRPDVKVDITRVWPCRDGYVFWFFFSGAVSATRNPPFVKWLDGEGHATEFMKTFHWDDFDWNATTQEEIDQMQGPAARFFQTRTKGELLEGARDHRVILYPVADIKDIMESEQLQAREFWVDLEHPELVASIRYPGVFMQTAEAPLRLSRRAPLIGEHNEEFYLKEMGLSREELLVLKQGGVI